VRSAGYEPAAPVRLRGSEFQPLRIDIDERPGSLVLEYKKVTP